MSKADLKAQVSSLEKMSLELKAALKHCEIAKVHFAEKEIPRACAHTFAVEGHIAIISELLVEMAKLHREKAKLNP